MNTLWESWVRGRSFYDDIQHVIQHECGPGADVSPGSCKAWARELIRSAAAPMWVPGDTLDWYEAQLVGVEYEERVRQAGVLLPTGIRPRRTRRKPDDE